MMQTFDQIEDSGKALARLKRRKRRKGYHDLA